MTTERFPKTLNSRQARRPWAVRDMRRAFGTRALREQDEEGSWKQSVH